MLLTLSPYENNLTAPANNQAIARDLAVAELAVQKLGLQESASSFLKHVHRRVRHRPSC